MSENKQTAIMPCPSNDNFQFLYKCTHFESLPPGIRRDNIRKLKLCPNCFGSHQVDKCTSKNFYRNNNFEKKHHNLLHDSFDMCPGSKKTNVKAVHLQGTGQVAVVLVQLKNSEKTLSTYAYLDNSSFQSLLLKSAASAFNTDMKIIGKMPISGYQMTKKIDCAPVKFFIKRLQSDQQSFLLTDVIAVSNSNMSPVDTEKLNQLCASFEHLSNIGFPEIGNNSVSIILGIDNLDLILYKQIVKGPKNSPWGVETQLGWSCTGKTDLALGETYPVQFTQLNSHPNMDEQMFKMVSN